MALVSVNVVVPAWPGRFVASGANLGGADKFVQHSRK